jgi:hypothetical protein
LKGNPKLFMVEEIKLVYFTNQTKSRLINMALIKNSASGSFKRLNGQVPLLVPEKI